MMDPSSDDLAEQLKLLTLAADSNDLSELQTVPIFTAQVRKHAEHMKAPTDLADGRLAGQGVFTQYGLLAADAGADVAKARSPGDKHDSRIFYNIAAPSSIFVCGSQGSGKSHTLSCLLENCLLPSAANVLPRPLTGIVFHYDTFITDGGGEPCEAAYLASNDGIKVRVLCAPTNYNTMREVYAKIPGVTVRPLRLDQRDLNTKRMMGLMGVDDSNGIPLYLHVVQRILRELRMEHQDRGAAEGGQSQPFQYAEFKKRLGQEALTPAQEAPLKQRLDTLQSFLVHKQAYSQTSLTTARRNIPKSAQDDVGTDWTPQASQLTIVDLSCPCVKADTACSLFNICLSLFLEQGTKIGRVVALDEAHKYLGGANGAPAESTDARALTESLLSTIRLQRHQACRVIIATQEPSVSPALLDLCSVTIVHRFTSPAWLKVLKDHLAGAGAGAESAALPGKTEEEKGDGRDGTAAAAAALFAQIVGLRVGEALLFAPSAAVGVYADGGAGDDGRVFRCLGGSVRKVRIRNRVTADGGRSIMAA
ncbi:hypothetical protein RB598_006203 [Gaeumannomyces tritici]